MAIISIVLKIPATSCGEYPTVKGSCIFYSLANPAARAGLSSLFSLERGRGVIGLSAWRDI